MNLRKKFYLLILSAFISQAGFVSCDKNTGDVNVFTIDDDKRLGDQVVEEIESDPTHYPILDSATYHDAYAHLYRVINAILNSGQLNHKDDFTWRARIIKDDSTLNAFCAPGGKIYVYTGIIKYLDSEDEFAGVMGHEMAHADRRHVTDELTKIYGLQLMIDLALGKDHSKLAYVAASLATLKFSRDKEAEADKYSVIYLYNTDYDARGVGRFFEKLIAAGQGDQGPEFLSDHPSPENRVQKINDEWQSLGGKTGETFASRYAEFKKTLP